MSKVLMEGNVAIGEAAVSAGCRFFFGYPITPQSEVPEYMSRRLPEVGGTFLQAESEIAAINMVYGAASTGVRVMTSSSGPGISLKQEGISYLAGAELPCLIVNMMRGGPGLGSIQPSQSDYFQATKGGGHGDYHMIVLAPDSVQEIVDLVRKSFRLADKYRLPVMLLGDGTLGQMMEPVDMDSLAPEQGQEKSWAAVGKKGRAKNVVNSLYIDPQQLEFHNLDLLKRYQQIKECETMAECYLTNDAEIVVAAYGISARISKAAVDLARSRGIKAGLFRPITLWPYPEKEINEATAGAKAILTVEMSMGQMVEDVRLSVNGRLPVEFHGRMGGMIPTEQEIYEKIETMQKKYGEEK